MISISLARPHYCLVRCVESTSQILLGGGRIGVNKKPRLMQFYAYLWQLMLRFCATTQPYNTRPNLMLHIANTATIFMVTLSCATHKHTHIHILSCMWHRYGLAAASTRNCQVRAELLVYHELETIRSQTWNSFKVLETYEIWIVLSQLAETALWSTTSAMWQVFLSKGEWGRRRRIILRRGLKRKLRTVLYKLFSLIVKKARTLSLEGIEKAWQFCIYLYHDQLYVLQSIDR